MNEKKGSKKIGRPTIYTEKLADDICEQIANSSCGLKTICEKNPHFPTRATIYEWISNNKVFSDKYAKAKETQAHFLIEEIIEIADDTVNDWQTSKNGDEIPNNEVIARSRLKVDTRKWIACKVLPKVYGDKIQAQLSGEDGKPIEQNIHHQLSIACIDDRIRSLFNK